MTPGDFFVRGRQLFGLIIPGGIWISTFSLVAGINPLTLVEPGNTVVRSIAFILMSYIVGFAFQVLQFKFIVDRIKATLNASAETMDDWENTQLTKNRTLETQAITIFRSRLHDLSGTPPEDGSKTREREWPTADFRTYAYCKWYVQEHSKSMRIVLIEAEGDINTLVGTMVSIPSLMVAWLVHQIVWMPSWRYGITALACFAISITFLPTLYRHLRALIIMERQQAYELFLLLAFQSSLHGGSRARRFKRV